MPRCERWDITAHVVVNEELLDEHCTSEDEDTVSTSIICEPGKRFLVKWKIGDRSSWWRTTVSMDGEVISASNLQAADSVKTDFSTCSGKRISKSQIRPFVFSNIKLTDDEAALDQNINVEDLGTITLKFERVRVMLSESQSGANFVDSNLGSNAIHERAKKVINHCVGLQNPEESNLMKPAWYTLAGNLDVKPAAVFRFSYGSKEFLQAQGIVEPDAPNNTSRSSRSPPTTNDPDEEEDAKPEVDEARAEAIRRLQARQAEMDRQRAEVQEELDRLTRPTKRVKREDDIKPIIDAFEADENGVIDLTDL